MAHASARQTRRERATIVCGVRGVDFGEPSSCTIDPFLRGELFSCGIVNSEVAHQLAEVIDQSGAVQGWAVWDDGYGHERRLLSFMIDGLHFPKRTDGESFANRLSRVSGDAWDRIEDPVAYIREMRE